MQPRRIKDDSDGYLCYAESDDGVTWVKPDLGLVVFDGSRKNNILLDSKDVGGVQGHMIVHDIDAPPAERYNLTIIKPSPNKEHFWIYAMVSADGLRFTAIPEPIFRFNSDTQNTLVRVEAPASSRGVPRGKRELPIIDIHSL